MLLWISWTMKMNLNEFYRNHNFLRFITWNLLWIKISYLIYYVSLCHLLKRKIIQFMIFDIWYLKSFYELRSFSPCFFLLFTRTKRGKGRLILTNYDMLLGIMRIYDLSFVMHLFPSSFLFTIMKGGKKIASISRDW